MIGSGKAVFVSYSSQDAAAAGRIAVTLRAAGLEVWFDRSELHGGDSWDQEIRRQIRECTLFVPIISASTQARREGYFRLEWKLADDRTHLMAKGTPFLVPVCIDETGQDGALVPDSFLNVQWTRLPAGDTDGKFTDRMVQLLAQGGRGAEPNTPPPHGQSVRAVVPTTAGRTRKFPTGLFAAATTLVIAMAAGLYFGLRSVPATPVPPRADTAATPGVAAEFPRDPELKRAWKLIYSMSGIAEDYALAEDIVKPLLAARPNDPETVTVAAAVAQESVTRGFELTQARRAQAQRLSERAVQLGPDNPDALAVLGRYLSYNGSQPSRAEELVRRAITLSPREPRYHRTLLQIIAKRSLAEADAFAARMAEQFPTDALVAYDIFRHHKNSDRLSQMEEWVDKAIALGPIAYAVTWKAWILQEVHGDVTGMKAWLDRVPDRERTTARVAHLFATHALITGQTSQALHLLQSLADPWLTDFDFTGPRALLIGDLLVIAGQGELARLQYESALTEVRRAVANDPTDLRTRQAEVWTLIGLERREEARAVLRLVLQGTRRPYRYGFSTTSWWKSAIRAALILDERAAALALLREACADPQARMLLRNDIKIDPRIAPFREDPEISALLLPPTAQSPAQIVEKSVAVLPFANLSDERANEYFSDGITEELINVLTKLPDLKVSARTSAFSFKRQSVPIPEIARQLGVAYVVEGSVRKAGDRVRITAQLIKAADGFHVWGETFTRELKDVFAVQDEIAGLVAKNISPTLTRGLASAASQPVDPEAFTLYLEGRAQAAKASISDLKQAITLFQRALQQDPNFQLARVQIARAHIQLGRWGGTAPREAWAAAWAALAPALAAAPDRPEVLVAHGWLLRTADWKWLDAERAFARALAQRPGDTDVLVSAAVLKAGLGKADEARTLAIRAAELDPLNAATRFDLGLLLRFSGRMPEAEGHFRRALELSPTGQRYRSFLALAVVAQGRADEAEEIVRDEPDELARRFVLGKAAAARGDRARLGEIVTQIEAYRSTIGGLADYDTYLAGLRADAGDLEGSLAALETARAKRDPGIGWLRVNHYLNPLHQHPGWAALLRSVGLAEEQLR